MPQTRLAQPKGAQPKTPPPLQLVGPAWGLAQAAPFATQVPMEAWQRKAHEARHWEPTQGGELKGATALNNASARAFNVSGNGTKDAHETTPVAQQNRLKRCTETRMGR